MLLSYVIGPTPMDLQLWPGAVAMMLIATLTAALVTNSGKSAWFVGVLVLMVYLVFAMTLYLLPLGRLEVSPHSRASRERSNTAAMHSAANGIASPRCGGKGHVRPEAAVHGRPLLRSRPPGPFH